MKKDTEHTDYEFNNEADAAKLRDAIEDINNRIDAFEQERASESEESETDDSQEIRWPTITNQMNSQ